MYEEFQLEDCYIQISNGIVQRLCMPSAVQRPNAPTQMYSMLDLNHHQIHVASDVNSDGLTACINTRPIWPTKLRLSHGFMTAVRLIEKHPVGFEELHIDESWGMYDDSRLIVMVLTHLKTPLKLLKIGAPRLETILDMVARRKELLTKMNRFVITGSSQHPKGRFRF
eukprot:Platyproteum_vivax@DN9729_c0_g1_i1.p1